MNIEIKIYQNIWYNNSCGEIDAKTISPKFKFGILILDGVYCGLDYKLIEV